MIVIIPVRTSKLSVSPSPARYLLRLSLEALVSVANKDV